MKIGSMVTLAASLFVLVGCGKSRPDNPNVQSGAAGPAMRAYIDPVTGQLGAPPASPSSQANPSVRAMVQSTSTVASPVVHTLEDGTVEMNLDRKQQIRVTRDADGTLHEQERVVDDSGNHK